MAGNVLPAAEREVGILQIERERISFPKDREFKILSLDGGGIKGLYTSAFLSHIESMLPAEGSLTQYFDLIAGTSTGGIIAIGLSAGLSAREIHDLYKFNGKEIFKAQSLGLIRPKYSAQILAKTLKEKLGAKRLRDGQSRICIPSANRQTGENVIFKTPHHPNYEKDAYYNMLDVALATSAAPTFMRAHSIGKDVFLDGAVLANNPVMIALTEALSCFDVHRRQVKILSISPGDAVPEVSFIKRLGGIFGWLAAYEHFVFHGSKIADGQAGLLIGRDRLFRYMPPEKYRHIKMDDYNSSLAALAMTGETDAEAASDGIRNEFLLQKADRPDFFH